ncbi:MAG: ankyrin repeat domain-containing protein [Puniceicoccales bacterium]|jgi:ankyrin repeat protein|nr:ankyrin repeat domain-containing protein [Puniceicoccales bacterium]
MDGKKILKSVILGGLFLGNGVFGAKTQAAQDQTSLKDKLLAAIEANDKINVKHALEKGVNINEKLSTGLLPLHKVVSTGESTSILRLLLDYGADPNLKLEGTPAIHLAVHRGSTLIIKILRDNGADLNAKDHIAQTPLMRTAYLILLTINQRPYIWELIHPSSTSFGRKLRHLQKQMNRFSPNNVKYYFDVMRLLMDYGVDANPQDKDGNTALHLAISSFEKSAKKKHLNLRLVKELVNYGVDINIQNYSGQTVLDLVQKQKEELSNDDEALINEYDQIIAFLLEYGTREG